MSAAKGRTRSFKKVDHLYDDGGPIGNTSNNGGGVVDTTGGLTNEQRGRIAQNRYAAKHPERKDQAKNVTDTAKVTNDAISNNNIVQDVKPTKYNQNAIDERKKIKDTLQQKENERQTSEAGAEAQEKYKQLQQAKENDEHTISQDDEVADEARDKAQTELNAQKEQEAEDARNAETETRNAEIDNELAQKQAAGQEKWDRIQRNDHIKAIMASGVNTFGRGLDIATGALGAMIKAAEKILLGNPLSSPMGGLRAMGEVSMALMDGVLEADNAIGEMFGIKDGVKQEDIAGTYKGAQYYKSKMEIDSTLAQIDADMSKAAVKAFGPKVKMEEFSDLVANAIDKRDMATLSKLSEGFREIMSDKKMRDIEAKKARYDLETKMGVPAEKRHRPSEAEMLYYNHTKNMIDKVTGGGFRSIERLSNADAALKRHERAEIIAGATADKKDFKERTRELLKEWASGTPEEKEYYEAYQALGHMPTFENTAEIRRRLTAGEKNIDIDTGKLALTPEEARKILNRTGHDSTDPAMIGLRQKAQAVKDAHLARIMKEDPDMLDGDIYEALHRYSPRASASFDGSRYYFEGGARGTGHNRELSTLADLRADNIRKGYEDLAMDPNTGDIDQHVLEMNAVMDPDYVDYRMTSIGADARAEIYGYKKILDKVENRERLRRKAELDGTIDDLEAFLDDFDDSVERLKSGIDIIEAAIHSTDNPTERIAMMEEARRHVRDFVNNYSMFARRVA